MHRIQAALFALALLAAPTAAHAGVLTVTQQSYDALGRVQCVAVRMNSAAFGSTPSDACTLGTEGSEGPDRITHNVYDNAGQLLTEQRAYGTALQQDYATYTYTDNGKRATVEDANHNRSAYTYDGFDRLSRITFPSPTTIHTPNTSDHEDYTYDANDNRTSVRLRSGDADTINYSYDFLNREILKDIPGGSSTDVYSAYNALGWRLYSHFASAGGSGTDYAYDGIGRITSETSYGRALTFAYGDALNTDTVNRTRLTWGDTNFVEYTFDAANRMVNVEENGATSGAGLLAVYAYDNIGRRNTITRGNGAVTTYTYDGISRLSQLQQNLSGTADDQTLGFTRNDASQIIIRTASNDAYHWSAAPMQASYTPNGLNQYSSVGGVTYTYDARGNLTSDGSRSFAYDLENHLLSVGGSAFQLAYDPLGRLRQSATSTTTTDFLYDGDRLVAEYVSGAIARRYVHGAGVDEPLVWYEGPNLSTPHYLIADNQGSIIADSASATTRYTYGPYGEPDAWTGSRFRYTGQIALPEAALYHYKARVYDPVIGRFLQTDPVGYQDDWNLYEYVRDDPLNATDPNGQGCAGDVCDPGMTAIMFGTPEARQRSAGVLAAGIAATAACIAMCESAAAQGLTGLAESAIQGARWSALAGGSIEAGSQVLSGNAMRDPGAAATQVIHSAGNSAASGAATGAAAAAAGPNRLVAAVAAASASFAATKAQGGSDLEAATGAVATAVMRALVPNNTEASAVGQAARQLARPVATNLARREERSLEH